MNPLQCHNAFLHRGNNGMPDEAELLQTDVMRFIAILGLCLMAIFALVQSLPATPPDLRPKIAEQASLAEKALELKEQIRSLGTELTALQARVEQAKREATQATEQAEQAQPDHPEMKQALPAAPKPEKAGFSLRFSSEDALNTLISNEQVMLFALVGKKAWRLTVKNNRPRFDPSSSPAGFYEMDPQTVPAPYGTALKKAVAAFGRGSIVWGVTLPAATRSDIMERMTGKKGGDLVIDAGGGVRLENIE